MSAQPREIQPPPAPVSVAHQALRREVNEHISTLNSTFGVGGSESIDVVCECVRANCAARIAMSVSEYEYVRRFPARFFVKEGHEIALEERVVSEAGGYVVIEDVRQGGMAL
jgi:hypothetical protein